MLGRQFLLVLALDLASGARLTPADEPMVVSRHYHGDLFTFEQRTGESESTIRHRSPLSPFALRRWTGRLSTGPSTMSTRWIGPTAVRTAVSGGGSVRAAWIGRRPRHIAQMAS